MNGGNTLFEVTPVSQKSKTAIDLKLITQRLKECPDILQRTVYLEGQYEAYFIYIANQIDKDLLQRDFITPILSMHLNELSDPKLVQNIPVSEIAILRDTEQIIADIMEGSAVLVSEMLPCGISFKGSKPEKRSIDEPITEKNVRGPHEGFIENLNSNLSILRRKIRNNDLKFKTVTLGELTNQKVAVAYIEGVTNPELVQGLFDKISEINTDGLPAIGFIEQSITSHPHSLFPEFLSTERPDKATAALLEGRIVILQEGTPVVLIAPVSFISFFQALDDYSTLWIHGTFLRLIRILGALVIAIFLPSIYIAITSFHYFAVPLTLLITLAESRSKVPFPPVFEILLLEITVELIREAAIRLPTYIGTAISVVAALIIGQAAVEAGIVSGLAIVIVGATAVASYVIPSTDMALSVRILRFLFIIAASVFGIIGIVVCTALTLAHLMELDSLGQPYFSPFSPWSKGDLKDTLLRLPMDKQKKRPDMNRPQDDIRGKKNEDQQQGQ